MKRTAIGLYFAYIPSNGHTVNAPYWERPLALIAGCLNRNHTLITKRANYTGVEQFSPALNLDATQQIHSHPRAPHTRQHQALLRLVFAA